MTSWIRCSEGSVCPWAGRQPLRNVCMCGLGRPVNMWMGTDVCCLVWLHSQICLCNLIKELIKDIKSVSLHPILTFFSIRNRDWCQRRQKIAVFLGKEGRQTPVVPKLPSFQCKALQHIRKPTLLQYTCTRAIFTPYSQLAIIPSAHELQFLHWKNSDSESIWYWFFWQPHTVSCCGVQGVSTICWSSEERKEKLLLQPLPSPSTGSTVMMIGIVIPYFS